jgi:hypothetical protein
MFALRLGQIEEGIKQYRKAVSYFRRSGNSVAEGLALAYFAQEAARADVPTAVAILKEAKDACKKLRHVPETHIVLRRAEAWLGAVAHRKLHAPASRP